MGSLHLLAYGNVNGRALDTDFGANNKDWFWESAGQVNLPAGETKLVLHDLTGFCGRCDAIFFRRDKTPPPPGADGVARSWRRQLLGLPDKPVSVGSFDVVVIGGGIPGAAAVLTAAQLGQRVALVHNRPYLGGNASLEIGLSPRGIIGPVVEKISKRTPTGDLKARQLLEAEPNVTMFLEYTVYGTVVSESKITSVDARDARSGREIRLSAPVFIDCSGRSILGLLSGAETLYGEESRAEYGEGMAPAQGSNIHHGNTVSFRTKDADSPVPFPAVPWATEVAKDLCDLSGQLIQPCFENGPGPKVEKTENSPSLQLPRRMALPLTHFWEYGQHLDPYTQGEHIRDHLLRAIYGTFSNVKTNNPETYANLELEWVAFVPAGGGYRRYKGDYVLNENDIRTHRKFPDAVVQNDGAFCLHYGGDAKYNFRLKFWEWDNRDGEPYDIPFRCLYSVNINNLIIAGKHVSATHVAGSNMKFMGNGGQHAIATAVAAQLCNKYNTTPRGVYKNHLEELRAKVLNMAGKKNRAEESHL
ncbi:hypothetical protein MGU_07802 [Metarhizium guizhouense ARSEF 977]|uniref:FAD dependent oxidoreductase n=1 Tax=Metarhizium guizhouense (strain ARSEF 977) TaxID=1276136 RepID=A0A0B4HZ17_METGA|nr:hypothetical protein MGU_07802 [Metarhizium guizhouense ARSEF 977]